MTWHVAVAGSADSPCVDGGIGRISRQLNKKDSRGVEVSDCFSVCTCSKIIGADAGNVARPVSLPAKGLLTDVAYRWDIVCDFSAYAGQVCHTSPVTPVPARRASFWWFGAPQRALDHLSWALDRRRLSTGRSLRLLSCGGRQPAGSRPRCQSCFIRDWSLIAPDAAGH